MHKLAGILALAATCWASTQAIAEQGVTDTEIRFAQVAAIEGPASALGTGMQLGILSAFTEVNNTGGVNGRMLSLESMDDGYEPSRSIDAVNSVIQSDNYLALIGPVGHADH